MVCGEFGLGCMFELFEIVIVVEVVLLVGLLVGKYVLVIFGLIYEFIDFVCYIVNCLLGV